MKRTDISRLRRNRALHFQIGLITALSFSLVCLNWTSFEEKPIPKTYELELDDIDFTVKRTAQPKKKYTPPPKPNLENISVIDDPLPLPEPEIVEPEPIIDVPIDTKVVAKKPEKKFVPPPPPTIKREEVEEIYHRVEHMPEFGDCSEFATEKERNECSGKNLLEFVYSKIKYPTMARENQVEGTVVVSFVVDKKGEVKDLEIRRDIGAGCGYEVLRVLEDLPDWKPGSQQGRKVAVMYNLPVKFSLQ